VGSKHDLYKAITVQDEGGDKNKRAAMAYRCVLKLEAVIFRTSCLPGLVMTSKRA
jgi:hypothetical protein